jgi:hypothetical protein
MTSTTPTQRAVVVYESMFGNTALIANAVGEGLREEGIETTVTDVSEAAPASPLAVDLLVLGAPTHAFSMSRPSTRADAVGRGADASHGGTGLREWLSATPGTSGHQPVVATFDTRVAKVRRLPLGAAQAAARLARHRGLTVVDRPEGFVVTDTEGPLAEGEAERAVSWGRELATHVARHVDTPTSN